MASCPPLRLLGDAHMKMMYCRNCAKNTVYKGPLAWAHSSCFFLAEGLYQPRANHCTGYVVRRGALHYKAFFLLFRDNLKEDSGWTW